MKTGKFVIIAIVSVAGGGLLAKKLKIKIPVLNE